MTSITKTFSSITNNTEVGAIAWSNPANAQTDDANIASAAALTSGSKSNWLWCTGAGFAVPAGSTIDGVVVTKKAYAEANARVTDESVKLIVGGTVVSSVNAEFSFTPNATNGLFEVARTAAA